MIGAARMAFAMPPARRRDRGFGGKSLFWRRRSGANPMVRNAVAPSRVSCDVRRICCTGGRKKVLQGCRGSAPQVPRSKEKWFPRANRCTSWRDRSPDHQRRDLTAGGRPYCRKTSPAGLMRERPIRARAEEENRTGAPCFRAAPVIANRSHLRIPRPERTRHTQDIAPQDRAEIP